MTQIYLAGPVAALDDGGAGWRETLIADRPDVEFLNPLAEYNAPAHDLSLTADPDPGADELHIAELVESDLALLRRANAVLVGYSDEQSVGTPMEVMWAAERDYPVALWVRDGTPAGGLSPWYRYHADLLTERRRVALDYLLDRPYALDVLRGGCR